LRLERQGARDIIDKHRGIVCEENGQNVSEKEAKFLSVKSRTHREMPDAGALMTWLVSGANSENRIHAEGQTQSEAWWRACQQAEAVGMLALAREA
jgi:hypothetical protein